MGACHEVQCILLLSILEIIEIISDSALDAVVNHPAICALPCSGESTLQGTGSGILQGDLVTMIRPQYFESLLNLDAAPVHVRKYQGMCQKVSRNVSESIKDCIRKHRGMYQKVLMSKHPLHESEGWVGALTGLRNSTKQFSLPQMQESAEKCWNGDQLF